MHKIRVIWIKFGKLDLKFMKIASFSIQSYFNVSSANFTNFQLSIINKTNFENEHLL